MTTPLHKQFRDLYLKGGTVGQAGMLFGLTAEEMSLALAKARTSKLHVRRMRDAANARQKQTPRAASIIFCAQCESRVTVEQGAACRKAFCKAKAAA